MRGYTLVEIIMVMLIFSLLSGLVVPRLMTLYDSMQIAAERQDIISQLNSLSFQAYQQGLNFQFNGYPLPHKLQKKLELTLPADWQVATQKPIQYRANGACEGGVAFLIYKQRQYSVYFPPPFCQAAPI